MQLYCSSWPTVGYHCFRYKFHNIFFAFPLLSFSSSGQQLCLPIRTDEFPLCLASNTAYCPRTYSSTPSDLISYYYCLCTFLFIGLFYCFCSFSLLGVPLRLIFFRFFQSSFFLYLVCSTFLTSILSLHISLFLPFFLPFLLCLSPLFILYLYVCLLMLSIVCFETFSVLYFSILRGMYGQPYYTNYSCSLQT